MESRTGLMEQEIADLKRQKDVVFAQAKTLHTVYRDVQMTSTRKTRRRPSKKRLKGF